MKVTELTKILNDMEDIIKFSFRNSLNVHSPIGGKYGELYVMRELIQHEPLLGKRRDEAKNAKNPRSADIFLKKTGKKIEVKWGALHYLEDDYYFRTRGRTEYWGWGFSKGTQFKKNKFDYCVMLCAEKTGVKPLHILVVTVDDLKSHINGRISGEAGKTPSYFVEFSEDPEFFQKRQNQKKPIVPCKIEFMIRDNPRFMERWRELKENGRIS